MVDERVTVRCRPLGGIWTVGSNKSTAVAIHFLLSVWVKLLNVSAGCPPPVAWKLATLKPPDA